MRRICYIPMLEGQAAEVGQWLEGVRQRWDVIPVMLPPVDWNDDLTPWPAGPIFKKGKSFGGKAEAYLQKLQSEIIPAIEARLGITPDERWLIGVSLAGLFAVWAAAKTSLFTRVASISGSFWYPGFPDWLREHPVLAQSVYISLGDKEAESKNPHLKSIARNTEEIVNILGPKAFFEWTEGTHFSPILPRLDKALAALTSSPAAV